MNPVYIGEFVAGEKPEPVVVTFTDADGNPIPLTGDPGYTAVWRMSINGGDAIDQNAVVTSPDGGETTYTWDADDLLDPGHYRARMWVGNGTQRFASVEYAWDVVHNDGGVPAI